MTQPTTSTCALPPCSCPTCGRKGNRTWGLATWGSSHTKTQHQPYRNQRAFLLEATPWTRNVPGGTVQLAGPNGIMQTFPAENCFVQGEENPGILGLSFRPLVHTQTFHQSLGNFQGTLMCLGFRQHKIIFKFPTS